MQAPQDWTFKNQNTREHAHQLHDYPARMIPQIAGQLLSLWGRADGILLDPYCGSGTTLVEGLHHEMSVVGFDLNPLARLIAKVKVTPLQVGALSEKIKKLVHQMNQLPEGVDPGASFRVEGISDLEFWFKKEVIRKLLLIKREIDTTEDQDIADFLRVAFSETVRESSNTRVGEFKLYRYPAEKLAKHNPDVFGIMKKKISRNLAAYEELEKRMIGRKWQEALVLDVNSCNGVPESILAPASVDLIITSPPYGDSRTTVAYGQYSRLSSAWIGLESPESVDKKLMGGQKKQRENIPSHSLNVRLREIDRIDASRGDEVFSFYKDLFDSIENLAPLVRPGGHVCYVVGNRTVKGVQLPTDLIVKDFFEACSFKYVETYLREIPNKRMPSKNSPSNEAGKTVSTMLTEYIVVLQK